MKKYLYTEEERKQLSAARKGPTKDLSRLVGKIRKVCISEGRVTEVETKRDKKVHPKDVKVVIEEPCNEQSEDEQVEVHGADGQTIVITQ